ncbi:hypothetical protein BC374_02990 [Ensifer sp. LC13]|nr:hypothetical protein BC362_21250 [Ensifer sp. LC14]OCP09537.1 hypothetical protein BC374_02990 [Ensifer sp. LC13]OCP10708.1 hypothetical protein BBX50_03330 [Ensifer sp. LC11]OCP32785.1 hypothetical protein BC364_02990 [Ensifer sp. LC499]
MVVSFWRHEAGRCLPRAIEPADMRCRYRGNSMRALILLETSGTSRCQHAGLIGRMAPQGQVAVDVQAFVFVFFEGC